MGRWPEHPFERALAVSMEDVEIMLRGVDFAPWSDFLLNPRRLRGSDFLMRWSQGVWSEERLTQAVEATEKYFALAYGPSGTAPNDDVKASELYFERLESAGLDSMKRPDLLIYDVRDREDVERVVTELNGVAELPFTREDDPRMDILLEHAVVAIECENSLWRARQMPDYGTPLKPQKRLGGRLGLKKNAVVPTVIIKEEDRERLKAWQSERNVPIHVWHAFFDEAFGISFDEAERLILNGDVEPTTQVFQSPGGATTSKIIYKVCFRHAYALAHTVTEPTLVADSITDRNGHILPYVRFVGGRSELAESAVAALDSENTR